MLNKAQKSMRGLFSGAPPEILHCSNAPNAFFCTILRSYSFSGTNKSILSHYFLLSMFVSSLYSTNHLFFFFFFFFTFHSKYFCTRSNCWRQSMCQGTLETLAPAPQVSPGYIINTCSYLNFKINMVVSY